MRPNSVSNGRRSEPSPQPQTARSTKVGMSLRRVPSTWPWLSMNSSEL
jgi:hypothetical protein